MYVVVIGRRFGRSCTMGVHEVGEETNVWATISALPRWSAWYGGGRACIAVGCFGATGYIF